MFKIEQQKRRPGGLPGAGHTLHLVIMVVLLCFLYILRLTFFLNDYVLSKC